MEQSIIELAESLGFVYKRLSKHLYLMRLYANKKRFGYHIIIPFYVRERK